MSRSDVDQSLCPEQLDFRRPLYHSYLYMQTVLQSLSPRRQPQERSRRGRPRAPGSNDAERGPALLVQLAQLQLLPPQGAPGWSTAKKWAAVEAASSSTRGSGWVLIGPAGSPVRRRRSRSGALPREDLDNTGAPQPSLQRLLSALAHNAGYATLRPASANPSPEPRWPAIQALFSTVGRAAAGCFHGASRSQPPAQQRRRPSRPLRSRS